MERTDQTIVGFPISAELQAAWEDQEETPVVLTKPRATVRDIPGPTRAQMALAHAAKLLRKCEAKGGATALECAALAWAMEEELLYGGS